MSTADARRVGTGSSPVFQPAGAAPLALPLPPGILQYRQPILCDSGSRIDRRSLKAKREREYQAGRSCAHRLLSNLGCDHQVGVNPDRSPAWPDGFVGSISHSDRWSWAAIARSDAFKSLGLDTEPVVTSETQQLLASEIASPREWQIAHSLSLTDQQAFSVVFSAKEAFYKCWHPITGNFFGFEDAIVVAARPGCVRIANSSGNPNRGRGPEALDVLFRIDGDDVFTITWIQQQATS